MPCYITIFLLVSKLMKIRNIAIIAHVDHGKTALTDAILKQTDSIADDSISMDSNALEKERGITIYSKNASVFYKDTKINIIDTPGHADFGSEVERVLKSIDSVLLIVDAQEGPMPQTRFVLKKSLELGLKPIVVINKIDKPAANPNLAHEQVFDLFIELGATNEQLDFTTVYTIGKNGIAKKYLTDESDNIIPLLDVILEKVPEAKKDLESPLRFQAFNLAYDDFLGRLAIGRIYEGSLNNKNNLILKKLNGENKKGKVTKIFTFHGLNRKEVTEAKAGDIVMVAGFSDIDIGETICLSEEQKPLPAIIVDEPTISLDFLVNNSPFAGREGKYVTSKQIKERLEKELEINVGLKISFSGDIFKVYSRGELHAAILIEQMRREGFELQVSQPQVIIEEKDGQKTEPFEEVTIDVPESSSGIVLEKMGKRKGINTGIKNENNQMQLIFEIPTRGLLGYRGEFTVDTRGEGILCSRSIGYRPYTGNIKKRNVGSMISMATGKALGFSLFNLQDRGSLYIGPGMEVYEGMVIGNTAKGLDMVVNPTKGKQLSNMRSSGADEAISLAPPNILNIEKGLEIISEDEYLEITPENIRLRKQFLKENERKRSK